MNIREANSTDVPFILQLLNQLEHPLNAQEINEKLIQYRTPFYHVLVLEIDTKVVGFTSLHWYDVFYDLGYVGRITAFCIDQDFRSKGIGGKLLQAAEALLEKQGCIRVEVSSNERRNGAHRFYLANGYSINSKRFIKPLTGKAIV